MVRVVTVRVRPIIHLMHSPMTGSTSREAGVADDKDMATEGTKDRADGMVDQVKGRARNTVGGATGDTSEQVKGKAEELKGKAKDALGKAKQNLDPNPGREG